MYGRLLALCAFLMHFWICFGPEFQCLWPRIFASLIMKECVRLKKIFKKSALESGVIFPLLKVGFGGSVSPEKIFD